MGRRAMTRGWLGSVLLERRMKYLAVITYLACIPLANWLISNVGTTCAPNGPCLIPVGFGLLAPSGVLVIGLALVLRDFVQCHLDRDWTITAVLAGATLSAIVAPPALVAASMASFLLSELADMGVYTPLRERRLALAVLASGLVGAIVDSVVFLLLAFGNLAYIEGLIVGKLWASVAAFGLLVARRRRWEIDA
jgi:queuosine precursor transporter